MAALLLVAELVVITASLARSGQDDSFHEPQMRSARTTSSAAGERREGASGVSANHSAETQVKWFLYSPVNSSNLRELPKASLRSNPSFCSLLPRFWNNTAGLMSRGIQQHANRISGECLRHVSGTMIERSSSSSVQERPSSGSAVREIIEEGSSLKSYIDNKEWFEIVEHEPESGSGIIIEHASKRGGLPGATGNASRSGVGLAVVVASRSKQTFDGTLELPVKSLKFVTPRICAKLESGTLPGLRYIRMNPIRPISEPINHHGNISGRGGEYEDAERYARVSANVKPSSVELPEDDCIQYPADNQKHGNVLVSLEQTVDSTTSQSALGESHTNEDLPLRAYCRTVVGKAEPNPDLCRSEADGISKVLIQPVEILQRRDEKEPKNIPVNYESPEASTMLDEAIDIRDANHTPSRIRRLELALMHGQRLRQISGTKSYLLFGLCPEKDEIPVGVRSHTEPTSSRYSLEGLPNSSRVSSASEQTEASGDTNEERGGWGGRKVVYDVPWMVGGYRRISSRVFPIPLNLQPPTNLTTPPISETESNTDEGFIDKSIRYSPKVKQYRKAQLHHDGDQKKVQPPPTPAYLHIKLNSKERQIFFDIMKYRTSRHERLSRSQSQTTNYTSIFELAKTAQARVRGHEDSFVVNKKQRQYVEITPIDHYEPSSPSDLSDVEGWLSDLSDDGGDVREEECKSRAAHRAAALAMLEGRAAPVEDLQPIFRSARMDYEDHVEAEHGQLYLWAPKPVRPATRIQNAIQSWDEKLMAEELLSTDDRLFGLGIVIPDQAGATDVLEWLNSDSPVDLLNGRPVFYYQPSAQADDFWDEVSLDQLNAENNVGGLLPPNVLSAQLNC